ncbi:MAG: hypothetical protein IKF39_02870 [Oscillospiraceae bacterium]|nr:hypothetical protein [Oscillospiraceae bacterium]
MVLLVDFENVDERGLKGVETLRETDRLIIFHNGTNKMTFGMHKRLAESRCRTEYIELKKNGRNALDFQLTTYLGYLIAQNPSERFEIISGDIGFDAVVDFWTERGVQIEKKSKTSRDEVESKLEELFEAHPVDFAVNMKDLAEMIDRYKTKNGLNNAIMKIYGSEKTGKINSVIRPLTKDKKGN